MSGEALRVRDAMHITIYYDPAQFAAWPFNHGFWAFPNGELLVGFSRGACGYQSLYDTDHDIVDALRGEYVTLRSTDGGRTWPRERLQVLGSRQSYDQKLLSGMAPAAPSTPFDFTSPDFCLTAGFGLPPKSAPHVAYLQYSRDRGQTWEGPYPLPPLGFATVQAKPDYLVRPDGLVLLFVTVGLAAEESRRHPRFVAVYASPNGGLDWHYLSAILCSHPDSAFVSRFYASPVLLPDGRILAALRCQVNYKNAWSEVFASEDGGQSWRFLSRVNDWGAPTHLTRLDDGRLLAVYGYRVPPYGIRARVSEDEGRTWAPELVLRDDGGSWDLGYPRTVKLPGGQVMAAYYFNRVDDSIQLDGGVRHIAATIFRP